MSNLGTVFARWRQINGEHYSTGGDRFNPPGLDCSGAIVFANRTQVPWLNSGNTASMARYAVDNGLVIPLRKRKPGDLCIYDKYGDATQSNGPRGHVGQLSENVDVTWEAASSGGVRQYQYARLGWVMCVDLSPWLGLHVGGPGRSFPGGEPDEEEEDLTPEQDARMKNIEGLLGELKNKVDDPATGMRSSVLRVETAVNAGNGKVQEIHNGVFDRKVGLQHVLVDILGPKLDAIKAKLGA